MEYIDYAKAIILAMGCRERIGGIFVGRPLIGTDSAISLILMVICERSSNSWFRRYWLNNGTKNDSLKGANVKIVIEPMPYLAGWKRNIVHRLMIINSSFLLSHTIIDIEGKERLEAVIVAKVDENLNVIEVKSGTFVARHITSGRG